VAQVTKPDVDFVFSLSPISIEQKTLAATRDRAGHDVRHGLPELPLRPSVSLAASASRRPAGPRGILEASSCRRTRSSCAPVFRSTDLDVVFTDVKVAGALRRRQGK
jgi:hypothetical protein